MEQKSKAPVSVKVPSPEAAPEKQENVPPPSNPQPIPPRSGFLTMHFQNGRLSKTETDGLMGVPIGYVEQGFRHAVLEVNRVRIRKAKEQQAATLKSDMKEGKSV